MLKSVATTKLYLKQRLQELNINEVSDLVQYMDTFNQVIGDLMLVKLNIQDEDNNMVLLCSLPPLLTALMSIKEATSLEKVIVTLQTGGINKSISRKGYGNEYDNGEPWLEVISWEPRAFLHHNFLTNEECEHVISLAKPNMVRSLVQDQRTGGNVERSWRTSTGTFLRRGQDEIVKEIERKISEFTYIPIEFDVMLIAENGEGLQVIHYEVGQRVGPHYDAYPRMATILMYLSDVDEGGETVFPLAKGNISIEGISVSPKKGDALLFWNIRPDGTKDPLSLHAGSPIIKGEKWACTKWFRPHEVMPFNKVSP